ncbi:MAG: hypothetical protein GKR94_20750 [Gammaproteobacteria bacterium]|nr:hypothetical protein [Gammaproteobacteria bacterium]
MGLSMLSAICTKPLGAVVSTVHWKPQRELSKAQPRAWPSYVNSTRKCNSEFNSRPFPTRFRHCNAQGCQVVIPADHSLLTNLKRANNGAGLFRLLNGKVIRVEFSLKGFTKAFNALASGDLLEE